jgi:hypothetical protein
MAQIVLTDVVVTINSVDLNDRATSVVLNYEQEAVEVTAFGDGSRKFQGGLKNVTATVMLQQDLAAGETEATIFPLVGQQTTIGFKHLNTTVSATNPSYTITGTYLAAHTPINGAVGELGTTELTFQGGTLVKGTGA